MAGLSRSPFNRAKIVLRANPFFASVSMLAGGSFLGQFVTIAISPLLTRLYSPTDFGYLATFSGVLGILGVVASLRYQLAIPLPENEKKALSVLGVCFFAVLLTSLIAAFPFVIFNNHLFSLFPDSSLGSYFLLIPLALLLAGLIQILQLWAIRHGDYRTVTTKNISQSVFTAMAQIGSHALGPIGLIGGRIFGMLVSVSILLKNLFSKKDALLQWPDSRTLRDTAIEYKEFPILSTWNALASSAASNLTPIMISLCFSIGTAGSYALTHRILTQPMAIIGQAVGDVFYRDAAIAHREGKLDELVRKVFSSLVAIAMPLALTIYLLIPNAFVVVFGSAWSDAGQISRYMTPWLFLSFVVTPATGIYPIVGMHWVALRFQLGLLFSSIFSIAVGYYVFEDFFAGIICLALMSSVMYLWRIMHTYSVVGGNVLEPFKILLASVPISIFCNAPLLTYYYFYGEVRDLNALSIAAVFLTTGLLLAVMWSYYKRLMKVTL